MEQNQDYTQPETTTEADGVPPIVAPELKSGMYWRKSKLFGNQCPPGILTLSPGRVRFTTATETVFDADITTVTASFSGWGTLTITADGRSYDFLGTAGALSKPFTAAQQTELADSARARDASAVGAGVFGAGALASAAGSAAAGALSQVAGAAILVGQYNAGVAVLKAWPPALEEAGAQVTAKKPNYMWWFAGILFGTIVAGVLITVLIAL